jgi:hypothetical protein|tara:strand:- start:1405 stop:1563 length:159 start_codon:yes stop_codon:yes gene_type:complete
MSLRPITNEKYRFGEKLRLAWYFETALQKLFIVLATLSLLYSIFRIIAQGFW